MTTIIFTPKLSEEFKKIFFNKCRAFELALDQAKDDQPYPWGVIEDFRSCNRTLGEQPPVEQLKLLVSLHVVADLVAQGWTINASSQAVKLQIDDADETLKSKDQVRRRHLLERDAQLREPATREFIRKIEKRRLTTNGWQSIFSLMRDGRQFASELRSASAISDGRERQLRLGQLIQPYLQFVRSGEVCAHTGLPLTDIWRYFRHTWVTAYRSVPGRSMMILVRDAAAPNHPVIGIAALGSAVVQQTVRDEWIGWDAKNGLERLLRMSGKGLREWAFRQLDDFTGGIYTRDLIKTRLITRKDLRHPSTGVVERLREAAQAAIIEHRKHPQKSVHKTGKERKDESSAEWRTRSETSLFRSKRCKVLATLLKIRSTLSNALYAVSGEDDLAGVFQKREVHNALCQLIRFSKAERVGINMMDITVCGAVAPYNSLLGGKLACLLLCSPEVGREYARRYSTQPSLIASCMKGEAIIRKPQLVVLGTTSLYGHSSSQYNRVRVSADVLGGKHDTLEYRELGRSLGYGSFHMSEETVNAMSVLLGRVNGGRRVNSIFGEGVNPLMRKIREALDLVGIPAEGVLRHGNRRIVYGVALASNLQNFLLGLEERPKYILPRHDPKLLSDRISDYWRYRWLDPRIRRPDILARVEENSVDFPVNHGARVPLPDDDVDAGSRLF